MIAESELSFFKSGIVMSCQKHLDISHIALIDRITRDLGNSNPQHNSSTGFAMLSLLFVSTSRADVSSTLQSDYLSRNVPYLERFVHDKQCFT
jgi:hypothetical protein